MLIEGKTPEEFAAAWYSVGGVYQSIHSGTMIEAIPLLISSREFAEWMTKQYRLAMVKGIYLGMEAAKAAADTQNGANNP